MEIGNLGQSLTAKEILELVQRDLEPSNREISLESVASVEAVTTIAQYLQAGGGKRLRPILVLLSARFGRTVRAIAPSGWLPWWR